jgi:hypothetical protein
MQEVFFMDCYSTYRVVLAMQASVCIKQLVLVPDFFER